MQRLEVSAAVRSIYESLGVKRLSNREEGGPCPVFAIYTPTFALQPRKKH